MSDIVKKDDFYLNIKNILQTARDSAYRQVNFIMVEAYWNIGKQIVQEEQNGEDRAEYGSNLIKNLSKQLTSDFGKGFTTTNLKMMRQFYNTFPNSHTLCDQLTWSHYRLIIRIQAVQRFSIYKNIDTYNDNLKKAKYLYIPISILEVSLRNRIFHHENILKEEFIDIEDKIYEILNYFDVELVAYAKDLNNE